ncbi:hypothetical protein [Ectothiorhodospira mobilis]|uniref:hypothetical protein n=1 Tax=Ectothiorhodospira mobilis TaxID=195064 RepID=UPI001EE9A970|nr:hypothetical protein [Ectothiorhodospira mobilis]MCG5536317.1 hypothetical protein [Ectothiorhodospira mobilis]
MGLAIAPFMDDAYRTVLERAPGLHSLRRVRFVLRRESDRAVFAAALGRWSETKVGDPPQT